MQSLLRIALIGLASVTVLFGGPGVVEAAREIGVPRDHKTIQIVTDNSVRKVLATAIVISISTDPARVTGNVAYSNNPADKAVSIDGPEQSVESNELKPPSSDGGSNDGSEIRRDVR